jgi:hypothetical protein
VIDPGYLIAFFSLFFIVSLIHIARVDVIYSGFYFFLFIYTIFAQIGYVYLPELSELLNAYYGIDIFYDYFRFVLFSFVTFYLTIIIFHAKLFKKNRIKVEYSPSKDRLNLFYVIVVCWQLYLGSFLIMNYDIIEYDAMRQDIFEIFMFCYKLYNLVNITLYCLLRLKPGQHKEFTDRFAKYFFLSGLIITVIVAIKSGNRNDLLMLSMSLTSIELFSAARRGILVKRILQCALALVLILVGLELIKTSRAGDDAISNMVPMQKLVYNDYFAPSHILLSAMYYHVVDPCEVLKSNVANVLVKMDYPYLQTEIGNYLIPDSSSRKTGFAFYILTEGYMAFGDYGFIYNGLCLFFVIAIWRYLSKSNNYDFNIFIMSIIVGFFAGRVRAQSSYFIKDIYMIFTPAMVLFYFATGLNPFKTWQILKPRTHNVVAE